MLLQLSSLLNARNPFFEEHEALPEGITEVEELGEVESVGVDEQ